MTLNSSLHIDIPRSTFQPHSYGARNTGPASPDYFQPKEESSFSFTRNGSQYLASPSSDTSSSPMMTPVPFKMQTSSPLLLTLHPGKDEKKRLSEFEFPASVVKVQESSYQSYLNHPFTRVRQQRLQEQQAQPTPKAQQPYISKYASYTSSSKTMARAPVASDMKPSTIMALSMIEKEKADFQYSPSNRDSLVSPPPPYLYQDQGVASLDQFAPSGPLITPESLAQRKRNSLPPSLASTPSMPPLPHASARSARELKRHSLPASSTSAGGAQWPSAMTMSVAAVTRPNLVRSLPSQAIPSVYSCEMKSPLTVATPTAVFTPRTTRFLENSETDTLYSYKFSEDGYASPKTGSASVIGSPHMRDTHRPDARWVSSSTDSNDRFPGFWQDAKEHRMNWMFCSFGAVAAGCGVWILLMPALVALAAVVPGVVALIIGAQYAGYRWRRHRSYKQQVKEHQPSAANLSSMRTAATAAWANSCSQSRAGAGSSCSGHLSHAHQPSNSSMHTSVGSVGSDSFLEPHQPSPPHILKAQFQHQYFRNASSATESSLQFTDGHRYQYYNYNHQQNQSGSQSRSPEHRQSWHSQQTQQSTPRGLQSHPRAIQRQESSSSIASSETVSSSSTFSELGPSAFSASPSYGPYAVAASKALLTSPVDSVLAPSSLLPSLSTGRDSRIMPPPPAYSSKKCDDDAISLDGDAMVSRDSMVLLDVALPEIASVGDLLSEIAADFRTLQF